MPGARGLRERDGVGARLGAALRVPLWRLTDKFRASRDVLSRADGLGLGIWIQDPLAQQMESQRSQPLGVSSYDSCKGIIARTR